MGVGGIEDMDARLASAALAPPATNLAEIGAPFRVEQVEGGPAGFFLLALALAIVFALAFALECAVSRADKAFWHRTLRPRLHLDVASHDDNQPPDC